MDGKDRNVRVERAEMDRLLNLKSSHNNRDEVQRLAARYQKIGWVLRDLDSHDGTDLGVDFRERPEVWHERLWQLNPAGPQINLGVEAGRGSGLLVLEVAQGQGEDLLAGYGDWRAQCVAALGDCRERHFYAWQPAPFGNALAGCQTPLFTWFGEGQGVLVPPSADPAMPAVWRWLTPPWEEPPRFPGQGLWKFLQDHATPEPETRPAVGLSWQEIYCLVSPYESLLQAMVTPGASMEDYYRLILDAAQDAGIRDPEVLLPLLWHAPQGDARQFPDRLEFLEQMLMQAQGRLAPAIPAARVPFEVLLKNALAMVSPTSAPEGPSGPAGFRKRRPGPAVGAGAAARSPFSGQWPDKALQKK